MRTEISISQTEATIASARASVAGCTATYVPTIAWLATTGIKRFAMNHDPASGPGGTS